MKSAKKLLGFDFDADAFARRALQSMKIRQDVSGILEKIVDEYGGESGSSDQESSRQIYLLFLTSPPSKLLAEFGTSSRVLKLSRVLTYSEFELPRIVDTISGIKKALRLIDLHFSIRTMLNVFETLLQVWDTTNAPILQAFVKKHLIDYKGSRKLVLKLKSDIAWYCENNSAIQLARHLLHSQIKLSDVWSYLELPDRTCSYRYFGAVSEAFVADNKDLKHPDNIKDIVDFLTKHRNKETNRNILPKLIDKLGRSATEDLRRPIQDYVLREWKDPSIADADEHWRGVTDETWRIFMQWIMKEDLHFFYDVVLKRKEKKEFWVLYAGKISSIRIVLGRNAESLFGNNYYYQKRKGSMAKLKSDSRNQHAIIIRMSRKTFIEFSTEDVCYVYDNASFSTHLSKSEYNMQKLADKSRVTDRVIYNNSWQDELNLLIKAEVGNDLLPIAKLKALNCVKAIEKK